MDLGRVGVWSGQLRGLEPAAVGEKAALVESLGYGALWLPGGAGGDVLDRCGLALAATERIVLATGILNIWRHDAADVAASTADLLSASDGRFLLGLGVSHSALIGEEYMSPMTKMTRFLDALDAAGQRPVDRVIAALRPRMLDLAATRAAGSHPYFVPPEHTALARAELGSGPLLAPEQTVVLARDPIEAREIARTFCSRYLALPNYTNNLRQFGYTDEDLAIPGSDRLVDAIVAWGTAGDIAGRVEAHLAAGADHVCIQVLAGGPDAEAHAWEELAGALPF